MPARKPAHHEPRMKVGVTNISATANGRPTERHLC
jgi:hypothetical protein